jgi:hypothetical protein
MVADIVDLEYYDGSIGRRREMNSSITDSKSKGAGSTFVLDLALPQGTDPAILPSVRHGIAQAVYLVLSTGQTAILDQADQLAGLVTGLIEPDLGLVEERLDRLQTIRTMFREEEWLTNEMLNQLQPEPPSNRSLPASDWKRRGRIFSVNFGGKEYFPRYEFDAVYQPLPVIRDILKAFGPVADSWKLAAWFHFPNGWIVEPGPEGPTPVAPKDALDRLDDLLNALKKRQGSYVA